MKENLRITGKFFILLSGCFLFLFLIGKTVVTLVEPILEQKHTYITLQEAGNLVWVLAGTREAEVSGIRAGEILNDLKSMQGMEGSYLTGQQAQQLFSNFLGVQDSVSGRYGKKEAVLAADFYQWFDQACQIYDTDNRIRYKELLILEKTSEAEQCYLTDQGLYQVHIPDLEGSLYKKVLAVVCENRIYAVREVFEDTRQLLENVWIISGNEMGLEIFWKDQYIRIPQSEDQCVLLPEDTREAVGDLLVGMGRVEVTQIKQEKISGKILCITQEGIELEEHGYYSFSEDASFYRIYGELSCIGKNELGLGYDFADFVIEEGKIAAGLLVREEAMESIRVLIRTAEYQEMFHSSVSVYMDCDGVISYRKKDRVQTEFHKAGEPVCFDAASRLFDENTVITITPSVLTGKCYLPQVRRSDTEIGYRGTLELKRQEAGIVVINELLLEEYLYMVVPSEMPASYPEEALKSQAVCARTYAAEKMTNPGLPSLGAHVDDSTAYQVYGNLAEQPRTSQAVGQTMGKVLFYEDKPAEVFYYSTSCGNGTDGEIWQTGNGEKYPYLKAKKIEDGFTGTDYEVNQPWYRWRYTSEHTEHSALIQRIRNRYEADRQSVCYREREGEWQSGLPKDPGEILALEILERGAGNIASGLLIRTRQADIIVRREYNIRAVLCDGVSPAVRRDGKAVIPAMLLPSAFIELKTLSDGESLQGYEITGGGYGHGVGMSQNGAAAMAEQGKSHEEILSFFFEGCMLKDIYHKEG